MRVLPGAVVLRYQSRDARAKVDDGKKDNGIDPVSSGDGGNGLGAESIHKILEDQTSQRADAGLDHRRDSEMKALAQDGAGEAASARQEPQKRIFPNAVNDQKNGHGGLGEDRSDGGAGNMPAKKSDQQDIQDHICDRRDQNRVKRRLTVSNSPEGGRVYIIHRKERNPGQHDPQIDACQVYGIRSRVEQRKQRVGQKDPTYSQDQEDRT